MRKHKHLKDVLEKEKNMAMVELGDEMLLMYAISDDLEQLGIMEYLPDDFKGILVSYIVGREKRRPDEKAQLRRGVW